MAEVLEKLEEQLKCPICLDVYSDPKLLRCFHVYCRGCLVKLVIKNDSGELVLTCPTCRQVTPIKEGGVSSLQAAFHINQVLDIRRDLQICQNLSQSKSGERGCDSDKSKPPQTEGSEASSYCAEHSNKQVEFYCETCEKLVCYRCVVKGGEHVSHDYKDVSVAFEKYKRDIVPSLDLLRKTLASVKLSQDGVHRIFKEISGQRKNVKAEICGAIDELHEALDDRKSKLLGQLNGIADGKLESLAAEKEDIDALHSQISNCVDFVTKSLTTDSQQPVLKIKTSIQKQVSDLIMSFHPDKLNLATEADMRFSVSPYVTTMYKTYGEVYAEQSPDPLKFHVSGEGVTKATVGKVSTVILDSISYVGLPCRLTLKSLQCELMPEEGCSLNEMIKSDVRAITDNRYEIKYTPFNSGEHQLHISVKGKHIRGSPFTVEVKKRSTPFRVICGLQGPAGITFGLNKKILVVERAMHSVSIFDYDGNKISSFGMSGGSSCGHFLFPRSIAVDHLGNIFVVDSNNYRIQKLKSDGSFVAKFGSKGDKPRQFGYPMAVAFNHSNNKVYVVDLKDKVYVLDSDLSYCSEFGKRGCSKGKFCEPENIAIGPCGDVYIADSGNFRIQVFDSEMQFLRLLIKDGDNKPNGVAVHSSGIIYVSYSDCQITMFSPGGQLLSSFGSEGVNPGQFQQPLSLAVNEDGTLCVCDFSNNRVQFL